MNAPAGGASFSARRWRLQGSIDPRPEGVNSSSVGYHDAGALVWAQTLADRSEQYPDVDVISRHVARVPVQALIGHASVTGAVVCAVPAESSL